jgi:hypothetical protein
MSVFFALQSTFFCVGYVDTITLLIDRAVPKFWSIMGLSEKDSGGSYVGDLIYATGLYRSDTPSKRVHFLCDVV